MGLLDHLPGTPTATSRETTQQAHNTGGIGLTPNPDAQPHQPASRHAAFELGDPEPEHLDAIYHHSHEVATAIKTLRRKTWTQRPEIEPKIAARCQACGQGIHDDTDQCPTCEGQELADPDPEEQEKLADFVQSATRNGQSLTSIGKTLTDDGNLHGDAYAVNRYQYLTADDGTIRVSILQEARAGDARRMEPIVGEDGNQGGELFLCITCRGPGYTPQDDPGACRHCGNRTYDAFWMEAGEGFEGERFYTEWEVNQLTWHYPDGSSPLSRLWDKALTLLWMDKTAAKAFDPRFQRSPGKLLVTMGGSNDAMAEWMDRQEEKQAENPYRQAHLHIEAKQSLQGDSKNLDATVLNLDEEFIKGQSRELREEFKSNIRDEYSLKPIDAGDTQDAGGLNNEGLQLRASAQEIREIQRAFHDWFDDVASALNVSDWQIRFPDLLEEDTQRDLEVTTAKLEAAEQAARLGLEVQWREGDLVIEDGDVEAPPEPTPTDPSGNPGGMAGGAPNVEQALNPSETNVHDVPSDLRQILEDEVTGPIFAADEIMDRYADVDQETASNIEELLVNELNEGDWSVQALTDNLEPVLEDAGIENARARARNIARTETSAIISEARKTQNEQLTAKSPEGVTERFRVVGASDDRTTKLSHWIREQIPDDGVPHDELVSVLDEAVSLAKRGAFLEDGEHGGVQGTPIELPSDFSRRGYVTHFQDRDRVERVVR